MAKRHFGEVITNYDPDNQEAKKLFKKAKKVLKDLTTAREVRFLPCAIIATQSTAAANRKKVLRPSARLPSAI
jgi:hypothetical protein